MTCDPWPVVWPCDSQPEASDEQLQAALSAAQSLLWSRTGRRLGLCTATEAYRPSPAAGGCGVPYMTDDRLWHNGGRRGGACCAINLQQAPVAEILAVSVAGVDQAPGSFRLESPGLLVRRGSCWPTGQPCDDPAVIVSYKWGVPLVAPVAPDPDVEGSQWTAGSALWGMAAAAMGEVAVEVINGMCGRPCKLPSRAVSITRQGVTVQLGDPTSIIEARLLGMPLADQLILSVNPNKLASRSRVYSPDMAAVAW